MKITVENFEKVQEILIEELKLFGHFDEQIFCSVLDWCGVTVRSGAFGFEIVIEKVLMPWQAARLIQIFRRFGFSDVDLIKIEGLQLSS